MTICGVFDFVKKQRQSVSPYAKNFVLCGVLVFFAIAKNNKSKHQQSKTPTQESCLFTLSFLK